jgi:hypothetical protein
MMERPSKSLLACNNVFYSLSSIPMKKVFVLPLLASLLPFVAFAQEVDSDDVAEPTPTTEETAMQEVAAYTAGIPTMVYYYVAGLIVFMILYFLVMKVVKGKGDAYRADKLAEITQKSEKEKQALLDSLFEKEGILHSFQEIVKGESIIGLRQCFPYQTLGGAAKDTAKTLGKQALWSMVGVKATYVDVGRYYLVLTEKNLHYLAFDKHSELAAHEEFPLTQLMNLTLRKAGTKEMMKNANAGGQEVLEFEFKGEKVSFTYYIQNLDFPNIELKEYQQALTSHYDAFFYVETMFKKKLEEKAGL